jgi:hypothetical protein
MATLRPLLAAALGLMLCVQGVAIAAAPSAAADAGSAMEIPCHDDDATSASDCCDGDCPDLAGCFSGPFAGAPAGAVAASPAPRPVVQARGWSPKTAVPPLPLRPPITDHA